MAFLSALQHQRDNNCFSVSQFSYNLLQQLLKDGRKIARNDPVDDKVSVGTQCLQSHRVALRCLARIATASRVKLGGNLRLTSFHGCPRYERGGRVSVMASWRPHCS